MVRNYIFFIFRNMNIQYVHSAMYWYATHKIVKNIELLKLKFKVCNVGGN
jgi:hypothetical protein